MSLVAGYAITSSAPLAQGTVSLSASDLRNRSRRSSLAALCVLQQEILEGVEAQAPPRSTRLRVERVRRRQEHDVGQVWVDLQVVILEDVVHPRGGRASAMGCLAPGLRSFD